MIGIWTSIQIKSSQSKNVPTQVGTFAVNTNIYESKIEDF